MVIIAFVSKRMSFSMSSSYACLITELDDNLSQVQRLKQGSQRAVLRVGATADSSGDKTDGREPRRQLHSKKTCRMKKLWRRMSQTVFRDRVD